MNAISQFLMRLSLITAVAAQANTTTVNLSEKSVTLDVAINKWTLKLSRAGYGTPTVKVLLPALADVTLLDHRNAGEGAPCLATFEATKPEEVIQGRFALEPVDFTIKLNKILDLNESEQTCNVSLEETVEGNIRGFKFEHQRYLAVGTRNISDCR